MKCADCQQTCLENGGRDLPAECLEHLVGCADCRKVNERTVIVTKLLALKKHEHPDPMFEIRNAAVIRKRLSDESAPAFEWLQDLLAYKRWHVALAGAVAVCLTVVAIRLASPAQNSGAAAAVAVQGKIAPQPVPDPNDPNWKKPMFVIQDTKRTPSDQIQYGNSNLPTRAVDYTPAEQPRRQE